MAGAFAATADDPSAMFYNVAGLAYQRRMSVTAGGTMITFDNEFQGSDDFVPGGDASGGYANHTFVPPNAYVVIPIGENMTFGLGQFTAFGLRTDWRNGNTFPGRFISQDANLKTVSVQPSFAMKFAGGKIAVGLGAEYRRSHITLERNQAQVFLGRIYDVAHARLNSDWNSAWGYDVGLMFRPNDLWSIGLQYRSDMDIDYEGDAKFTQIATGNPALDAVVARGLPPSQGINTTLSFPAFYTAGIATKVIPNWTIELDGIYNTWSRFESLQVAFEQTPAINLDVPEDWDNSYSIRLGADHPVTDRWNVRLGTVYDNTPQPVEGVGPLLPDADRLGVTFGLGYHGARWSVDVSDMVLHFYDRDTMGQNRDEFNGTYTTSANLLAINLGYNF
jgi:long-chain fatty acid transport protein